MEQHAIPSQISTYQFRLIGDMTIRQFGQLAGGIILALISYSLPIYTPIKWFLILLFGFSGFALAFLPLEDRPLDKWIAAFFKSVFAPTEFIWKKEKTLPDFLKELTTPTPKKIVLSTPGVFKEAKSSLQKYLETFSAPTLESKAEKKEKLALEKIGALFKTARLPLSIKPEAKPQKISETLMPQLKIKPRKLVVPPSEPIALKMTLSASTKEVKFPSPPQTKDKDQKGPLARLKLKIAPEKEADKTTVEATTSASLPIPTTPTQANIIVGMVLDQEGKMVENAIIEIRDKDGLPVRALRSNRLGQFQIVTPLANGDYEIEIEKEGLEFDIIKLALTGEIIAPIEIKARGVYVS
jgi:hypothetical protein